LKTAPKPVFTSANSRIYTNLQNHRLVIARRRSRRSNPDSTARTLDCFAPLAMTVNDFAGWYHCCPKLNRINSVG
jgi:hypothetical protein